MIRTLWECTGVFGAAWLGVTALAVLCLYLYVMVRPLSVAWTVRGFVVLALLAGVLGQYRSDRIDTIQLVSVSPSAEDAIDPEKAAELTRRASRVRFAEDDKHDAMDLGGVSASELSPDAPPGTSGGTSGGALPAYLKRGKQVRDASNTVQRPGVPGAGVAGAAQSSAQSQPSEEDAPPVPVIKLAEPDYSNAHWYDAAATNLSRALLWLGLALLAADYFRRLRKTFTPSVPWPWAGRLLARLNMKLRHAWVSRATLGGHPIGALAAQRSVRKGRACLYVGSTNPWPGEVAPRLLVPSVVHAMPTLSYTGQPDSFPIAYALESLWHSAASLCVIGPEQGQLALRSLVNMVESEQLPDVMDRPRIDVIWDLPQLPEPALLTALLTIAGRADVQLLLITDVAPDATALEQMTDQCDKAPKWDLSPTLSERLMSKIDARLFAR